jgi:hypothetical protein
MAYYLKAKDVFIQRRTADGKFEEYGLLVAPNSFIMCDSCNNLVAVPSESISVGGSTVKVSITDTIAEFLGVKLVAGTGISITTQSLSGVESIKIAVPGSFTSAAVSINGSTLYEVGTSQIIAINGSITRNSETTFSSGSIRKNGGVDWYTFTSASSYSTSDTGITTNTSYVAYMGVGNDGTPTLINSSTKTATFIYPFLWGTSTTPGMNGSTLYTTLTKSVTTQGTKTANLSGTGIYVYFAYPIAYGALSSIKDQNNFELISSFEVSSSVSVTSAGLASDWTTNFYVYRTKVLSNGSNPFTFYF